MNRLARLLLAAIAVSPLAGCGLDQHPSYSGNVRYGVRTDPIVVAAAKLGEERYEPDRPGILPIMKMEDINNPAHPWHAKKETIQDSIVRDPTGISADDRKALDTALEDLFGTPANPKVDPDKTNIDKDTLSRLRLDSQTLVEGSKRYRVHCLHCHGVPGDGRGPTARWINPHPRDFRAGVFKFQSRNQLNAQTKPSREDLVRTLRNGIENTAMPSFALLKDEELEQIVSYVIHLSMRGEVELRTLRTFDFDAKKGFAWDAEGNGTIAEAAAGYAKKQIGIPWKATLDSKGAIEPARARFIKVPGVPADEQLKASVLRGQQIFTAKITDDFKMYHVYQSIVAENLPARLDELLKKKREAAKAKDPKAKDEDTVLSDDEKDAAFSTDELAAFKKKADSADADALTKAEGYLKSANCVSCHTDFGRQAKFRFDDWGTLVRPNNITLVNLRGGKRPVDIYYRIHSGIPGSGMTPFGKTFAGNEHYIWDLVNFVTNVPYPAMRAKLEMKLN